MATTANLPPGATPTSSDPFLASPTHGHPGQNRYASFDAEQHSLYSTSSPSQARRALEAHLKDTDRRIQDASKLGSTLVNQRKDLAARLREVEDVSQDQNEVPADLRKRLADLEKEYNEVGKESARAFLPKSRTMSNGGDPMSTPSAFSGSGRESPTKMTAPSRKQRNQPSNRVHDIEFATEISTSLLAQVRQLQSALAEKDDELKDTTSAKAQLEADAIGMTQRIRQMDDSEHRYKDENWNLEMKLQELQATYKESTDKESRLTQSLKATESEKAAAQRDLDDLKVSHEKLDEEHGVLKKQQETDLHGLRRDAATNETEKSKLQTKVEELTSQNVELAKAVSYRLNQSGTATDTDFVSADEEQYTDGDTPENSEAGSPVKGTPRHALESETLKSSLNHAHRMIQNLKNNIHREKTEKLDLKRMLQDTRDELESRRSDGNGASLAKKRKSEAESAKFKKPLRSLGANRGSTTEITEDEPDWEDHDGQDTPSKSRTIAAAAGGAIAGAAGAAVYCAYDDNESTDAAFETATERGGTTTDAFDTSRENFGGDDSDELTETESGVNRSDTVRRDISGLSNVKARDRRSFQSTASTDDDEEVRTPVQAQQQQQKYRLRMRSSKRGRLDELAGDSPSGQSPASSTGTPQPTGQSLGDELDALDEGTPSRDADSAAATPQTERRISEEPEIGSPIASSEVSKPEGEEANLAQQSHAAMMAHEHAINKPTYADAGVMTDPWEPETITKPQGFKERATEVVGGALAGFGLGGLARNANGSKEVEQEAGADVDGDMHVDTLGSRAQNVESRDFGDQAPSSARDIGVFSDKPEPKTLLPSSLTSSTLTSIAPTPVLRQSEIISQETAPVASRKTPEQNTNLLMPSLPTRSSRRPDGIYEDSDLEEYDERGIPGTDGARPGAGFFDATALGELDPNAVSPGIPPTRPLSIKKLMMDEGSQTTVSGDDIENMIREKSPASVAAIADVGTSPARPSTAIATSNLRQTFDTENPSVRTPRRPASAGSMRNKGSGVPPPLPEDHTQKIAKAQKTPGATTAGTMGPPLMPASAYKPKRPRTPAENGRTMSRDGTTPRAGKAREMQSPTHSQLSRHTSVSSFASEIDERFQINRGQLMYPEGVIPATDPRMIQAITQTMIGEYLWKYTRKAGRSETSTSRHRRFFWVHPYTRTLYWSEKDPSTAGRDMLKAKSVAIQAVRVITDDNAYPPGLHRKSMVVVTPGREIVFTAPTSQRHETWFNALSYLLLRTEQEKEEADDAINQEDIDEFNPGTRRSFRRSISRLTGRSQSRVSLSSYNSRTTRNSSTHRTAETPTLAQRQSAAADRAKTPQSPTPNPAGTSSSRYSTVRDSNAGRLSSFTSKFRPPSAQRGSFGSNRGRSSTMSSRNIASGEGGIYNASVAAESAEDLRAVIEKQEEDADRLENVRACCDGKHDVGSLSRKGRHSSFSNRKSMPSHSHAHPRSEPIQESSKPRRGE